MEESKNIKHYTAHWHTSPYPLMVGFGAGLFLPWAFMLHFNYGIVQEVGWASLAAIIVLGIGALLLIVGGIGWAGETIGVIDDEGWSPSAMFMFIGTEIMTIGGVLMGYWAARFGAEVWPPAGTPDIDTPWLATGILILSSFTIGFAHKNELKGNASGYANMVLLSIVIWAVFAVMVIMGWQETFDAGLVLGEEGNAMGTALYGITGIHFAHIVFGLLIMLTCLPTAFKGRLSHSYTRSMAMYVHFVNVLGIWVLFQVYLW